MIRRPPRSTQSRSSAASDVYKRQAHQPQGPRPACGDADAAPQARRLLEPDRPLLRRFRVVRRHERHRLDRARCDAPCTAIATFSLDFGDEPRRVHRLQKTESALGDERLAAAAAAVADEGRHLPHVLPELNEPALARLMEEVQGFGRVRTCLLYTSDA